jgi:hypothetical protein
MLLGCGPDPNAKLPQIASSGTGGVTGVGGSTSDPGTGGSGSGGSTPVGTGGTVGTGGVTTPFGGRSGTGGRDGSGGVTGVGGSTVSGTGGKTAPGTGGISMDGGAPGRGGSAPRTGGAGGGPGGRTGTGGTSGGGTTGRGGSTGGGGTTPPTSGALTTYTFGPGEEPCTPAKDVSGGQSGNFGTKGAFCFRTADDFTDYGCSGADGRTLKINGTAVTSCGGKAPAKLGSFYYFDFSAGTYEYASVNWYCSTSSCLGPHPVPSCGHYPPWVAGGSAAPCAE